MRKGSSFAILIFVIILGIGSGLAFGMYKGSATMESAVIGVIAFVIALVLSTSIRVVDQWERVVILRLGKFRLDPRSSAKLLARGTDYQRFQKMMTEAK